MEVEPDEEFVTIRQACRIIGGDEDPIHPSTYYRGVKSGRYPRPTKVAPNVSRVLKRRLRAALARLITANDG
jgi:hypothetical protein